MNVDMKIHSDEKKHPIVQCEHAMGKLCYFDLCQDSCTYGSKEVFFVYFRKSTVHVSGIMKKTQPIAH